MQNRLHIYIPRILDNINKMNLINTFKRLNIGNVCYVDMHRRVNENGNAYKFAFIDIETFKSEEAKTFVNNVKNMDVTNINYDLSNKNKYWEIKNHVPRDKRPKPVKQEKAIENQQWKAELDLVEEFDMLSKEIYYTCRETNSNDQWKTELDWEKEFNDLFREIRFTSPYVI